MENYEGDLADIIRASGGSNIKGEEVSSVKDWQFMSNQIDYPSSGVDEFGDPFSSIARDPLLHELDHMAGSCFFQSSNTSTTDDIIVRSNVENTGEIAGVEISRPSNNIFSRMLQISPNAKLSVSPIGVPKPPMLAGNEMISSSKGSLVVENGGVQISSPRNTGIKRRKSQAKKVVCIPAPAPAPANSRPSGEVVPSDLWAWRKYGQKPIKGSPYPRGYYRCSSSKGCSARKQVERSRTDPNMLVITYTSEHNHPWPTQRNALAGSTRAQLSKTTKGEQKDNVSSVKGNSSITGPSVVKEEMQMEVVEEGVVELSEGFSNRSEDFFADLGELETDPLNLLFTQGYSGDDQGRLNKASSMDPFAFYDWTGNNSHENNNNNNRRV